MKSFTVFALFFCASAAAGEPPLHGMIDHAYFVCPSSRSLQGGIFGKGPTRRFGPQPGECAKTEWVKIPRAKFKELAVKWYGIVWKDDIPFFSRENEEEIFPGEESN